MNKEETQKKVDELAKELQSKKFIFLGLQEQIEKLSEEVVDKRMDLLNEIDEDFGYDEYYKFSNQLDINWLPSSYQC